jgi:hypothetical protein
MTKDSLTLLQTPRVQIGGQARGLLPGSVSVLEVGSTTIAFVPGVNFPKYRLEAGLVRCTAAEVADATPCARALFDAEVVARGEDAREILADAASPAHWDVLSLDIPNRRNVRVSFFESPATDLALWVHIDAYPALDEPELEDMLAQISVAPSIDEAP